METKITDNIIWKEFERNVRRLKGWTPEQRQIRLENLYKLINPKQLNEIKEIVFQTCYNENFFIRTRINYSNPDSRLIEVSLLDHLLK